jgi:hypothetical protein
MQGQPICTKSAFQRRGPSSVHSSHLASQIGSFSSADLKRPILNLICLPMLLLVIIPLETPLKSMFLHRLCLIFFF